LLLSRELADSRVSFIYVGTVQTANGSATHIQSRRQFMGHPVAGSTDDWYLDSASNLPVRYRYNIPAEGADHYFEHITVSYKAYQAFGAAAGPGTIVLQADATSSTSTCTIATVSLNTNPASSSFDAPNGGAQ